jgi:hypothetical protein
MAGQLSSAGTCRYNTACNIHAYAGFGEGDVAIDNYYTAISVSAVNATVSISLGSADFSATTACFLEDPVGPTGAFVLTQAVGNMAVSGSGSGTISAKTRCYNYVSDRVTQLALQRFGCSTVTETVTWFKTRLNTRFSERKPIPDVSNVWSTQLYATRSLNSIPFHSVKHAVRPCGTFSVA